MTWAPGGEAVRVPPLPRAGPSGPLPVALARGPLPLAENGASPHSHSSRHSPERRRRRESNEAPPSFHEMRVFTPAMILLVVVLATCLGTALSNVSVGQREALVALYDATGGRSSWFYSTNWVSSIYYNPCSAWYGVQCNANQDTVT
jgi:hypothetical protein